MFLSSKGAGGAVKLGVDEVGPVGSETMLPAGDLRKKFLRFRLENVPLKLGLLDDISFLRVKSDVTFRKKQKRGWEGDL
jgi:hypothetical protein